jgi:ribosome-interacting GTPase 1
MIGDVEILSVSVETGQGIEELQERLFRVLDIIRVYTRKPGKPADMNDPVIVPVGSTVMDAAYHLHKDFARKLTFARLWNGTDHEGQRVDRGHVLQDLDVVEFHI